MIPSHPAHFGSPVRRAGFLAALALGAAWTAGAQSTRGTDFWSCQMENMEAPSDPFAVLVANPGPAPATVVIEGLGGELARAIIAPGAGAALSLPPDRMLVGTVLAPLAFHVTSDVPVEVAQLSSPLPDSWSSDASVLLPAPALGTEHLVVTWPSSPYPTFAHDGELAIVALATEPTTVTVVPTADLRAGFVPATPAGTPVTFAMNRFDAAQLMTQGTDQDLTGTLVSADRPVAVFGGTRCSNVPVDNPACDHLEEPMMPLSTWGRRFVVAKLAGRDVVDVVRVVAATDDTIVATAPDLLGGTATLQAGEHLDLATSTSFRLTASGPVEVAQFMVGAGLAGPTNLGDPSYLLVPPVDQYLADHGFVTPSGFDAHRAAIVRPAGLAVLLDGMAIPDASFEAVADSGFEAANVTLSSGVHRVTAAQGVSVHAHGVATTVSYAFVAGRRVASLDSRIACDAGGARIATCAGGQVRLDGSASTGPAGLDYSWSALTPGLTIATPLAAITDAVLSGPSAWAALTVRGGGLAATCAVEIESADPGAPVPSGLSESAPWLRVRKDEPAEIDLVLSFESRSGGETANAYAGTLLPTGLVAYDHAPIACALQPAGPPPALHELRLESVPGLSRYFLVSASSCAGESTRGQDSFGVERPPRPTDCGASP